MGVSSPVLLERTAELARLDELLAAAAEGRGGVAAILGPAGIGKTSLLDAVRRTAAERDIACLYARGGELERDFAYGIVRQLLERPLRELPERERELVLDGAARPARQVIGLDAGGEVDAFAAVHSVYWTCANLAASRPLLIAVDDLHWADLASLRSLAYLARRVADLPILLLTATRPVTDAPHAELLGAVTTDPEFHLLAPAALSVDGVRALLGGPDEEFARECWEATAGNPFLCQVLLNALRDGVPAPHDVGASVAGIVVQRIGRLSDQAAGVARAVAILGANADLRHAAALAGIDVKAAAQAADQLAAHGILRVGRPLEFAHPLVRRAVAETMPPAERMLAHARAARVLEGTGAPADAVALHLLAAEPAADPWAVTRLHEAARRSLAQGALDEGRTYLLRALEEPPPEGDRAAILHELGRAELLSARPMRAAAHLRAALSASSDARQRLRIAQDLGGALTTGSSYEAAATVIVDALAGAPDQEDPVALSLRADLVQIAGLEPDLEHLLATVQPDPAALHASPEYLAALVLRAGLVELAREKVLDLGARIRRADISAPSLAWANVVFPVICADGFELADTIIDDWLAADELRESPVWLTRGYGARSMLHVGRGELREAVAHAQVSVDTGRAAGVRVWVLIMSQLVEGLVERGDLEAADAALAECGLDGEIRDDFLHNWLLGARGRLRIAQLRIDEALADLFDLQRRLERRGHVNPAVAPCRAHLARALLRSGDREGAEEHARANLENARRWGAPRALSIALTTLGLVREGDDGLALLRDGVAVLEGSEARLARAHALAEYGAALRRSGARAAAREPLLETLELAHACGAVPLEERAREELLAAGARPRRVWRTGVDALTPSELRVARMAAEGLSNREIAQALFVTLRTVELHLTHAYQKLDVSAREELPDVLATSA